MTALPPISIGKVLTDFDSLRIFDDQNRSDLSGLIHFLKASPLGRDFPGSVDEETNKLIDNLSPYIAWKLVADKIPDVLSCLISSDNDPLALRDTIYTLKLLGLSWMQIGILIPQTHSLLNQNTHVGDKSEMAEETTSSWGYDWVPPRETRLLIGNDDFARVMALEKAALLFKPLMGFGTQALPILNHHSHLRMVGCELNPKNIERATFSARRIGIKPDRLLILPHDVTEPFPLPPNIFDRMIMAGYSTFGFSVGQLKFLFGNLVNLMTSDGISWMDSFPYPAPRWMLHARLLEAAFTNQNFLVHATPIEQHGSHAVALTHTKNQPFKIDLSVGAPLDLREQLSKIMEDNDTVQLSGIYNPDRQSLHLADSTKYRHVDIANSLGISLSQATRLTVVKSHGVVKALFPFQPDTSVQQENLEGRISLRKILSQHGLTPSIVVHRLPKKVAFVSVGVADKTIIQILNETLKEMSLHKEKPESILVRDGALVLSGDRLDDKNILRQASDTQFLNGTSGRQSKTGELTTNEAIEEMLSHLLAMGIDTAVFVGDHFADWLGMKMNEKGLRSLSIHFNPAIENAVTDDEAILLAKSVGEMMMKGHRALSFGFDEHTHKATVRHHDKNFHYRRFAVSLPPQKPRTIRPLSFRQSLSHLGSHVLKAPR